MSGDLNIQWLDSSGWATVRQIEDGCNANGNLINMWMNEVAKNFPGRRVRAVDENGRIVDML